jgi:hypothetical protein
MSGNIIFAAETEELSLHTFASEAEAAAHCEGLDVEAAVWLFWDSLGKPLTPIFSTPNKRGLFVVRNGIYRLLPAEPDHHAHLAEMLEEFLAFEGNPPFNTFAGVQAHLNGLNYG